MVNWRLCYRPVILIPLLVAFVRALEPNIFDVVLFLACAGMILLDSARTATPLPPVHRLRHRWTPAAGVIALSGLTALFPIGSVGLRAVVVAAGLVLGAYVWRRVPARRVQPSADRARGWWLWVVVGIGACLWELTSFIFQSAAGQSLPAHPTVSDLVGPLLGTWLGRAVFLLLWLSAGWWLLKRFARVESATGPKLTNPDASRRSEHTRQSAA